MLEFFNCSNIFLINRWTHFINLILSCNWYLLSACTVTNHSYTKAFVSIENVPPQIHIMYTSILTTFVVRPKIVIFFLHFSLFTIENFVRTFGGRGGGYLENVQKRAGGEGGGLKSNILCVRNLWMAPFEKKSCSTAPSVQRYRTKLYLKV